MANGMPNPLSAPLSSLKQMGAQGVQSVNALNTGIVSTLNQGIDALIMGVPPLPGVPGAAAGAGILPTQILPANLTQALGQIENVLIPPGLPRPSAMVAGAQPQPPAPTPPAPVTPSPRAVSGLRRITELGGY